MSIKTPIKRHTIRSLAKFKGKVPLTMLTAYDVMTAQCLDEAGIDMLLVGDSVGNVVYGMDDTLGVTLDMIVAHTKAVVKGSNKALVVSDLPFMTFQVSAEETLKNAARCLVEGGAQAVKIEGASSYRLHTIERLVDAGIPVMGHIGLTPQSVHQLGGYYTHGKDRKAAEKIFEEAKRLEGAGCFAIVLECLDKALAAEITRNLRCFTIGIGSGLFCDGQVLVINDLLGYTRGRQPSFAEPKINLKDFVTEVAKLYIKDTRGNSLQAHEDICH